MNHILSELLTVLLTNSDPFYIELLSEFFLLIFTQVKTRFILVDNIYFTYLFDTDVCTTYLIRI